MLCIFFHDNDKNFTILKIHGLLKNYDQLTKIRSIKTTLKIILKLIPCINISSSHDDQRSLPEEVAVNFSVIPEVVTKLGPQQTGIPSEMM